MDITKLSSPINTPNQSHDLAHDLIYTDWTLIESQFDPAQLHSRETVFAIGNDYMGTRGSFEEGYSDALPDTLVHGYMTIYQESIPN
jgi:kojibiose phosphorylase